MSLWVGFAIGIFRLVVEFLNNKGTIQVSKPVCLTMPGELLNNTEKTTHCFQTLNEKSCSIVVDRDVFRFWDKHLMAFAKSASSTSLAPLPYTSTGTELKQVTAAGNLGALRFQGRPKILLNGRACCWFLGAPKTLLCPTS